MNICFVLISDGWGGAENVVYELARHFRDRGDNVSLILNEEIIKYYRDLELVETFDIGCVFDIKDMMSSIAGINNKIPAEKKNIGFPWSFVACDVLRPLYFRSLDAKLQHFLDCKKIDIIHSHLENSDILVSTIKKLEIPWVSTIHGLHLPKIANSRDFGITLVLKKWKTKHLKRALNKVDMITFVSKRQRETFEKETNIKIDYKSIFIPNGIELADFQRTNEKHRIFNDKFNVIFPGGAKPLKGGAILVDAMNILHKKASEINLHIALDVPENSIIRKKVKEYNLENVVKFCGFMPYRSYLDFLSSADMLCLPSQDEAFPLVLLEAMALGKPIVATDVGDIHEIINDGINGMLVNQSPSEIADAILLIYSDKKLYNKIAEKNLECAKNFNWREIVNTYHSVYGALIDDRDH